MNKFWVVGTSSKKYINEFINILKQGFKVGDYLILDNTDTSSPKITCDGEEVSKLNSYIVARQRFDVWEGMGLVEKNLKGYKIMMDKIQWDKIVDFTKLSLLDISERSKVNEFRFTTIITTLVHIGILNNVDLKKLNIKQTRGEINIEKIERAVSDYEIQLSEDKVFIKKMKEVIKNV